MRNKREEGENMTKATVFLVAGNKTKNNNIHEKVPGPGRQDSEKKTVKEKKVKHPKEVVEVCCGSRTFCGG